MPFTFDITKSIGGVHSVEVSPSGWKSPVVVEYGVAQVHPYDPILSVVWRVRGTDHCFTIGEHRLNTISNGDYKQHFKKALEAFRDDYLSWFADDFYKGCEWIREYERQFSGFILPEQSSNHAGPSDKN